MATSILLRSARSFLGSKNMLPAAGATACTAIPLGQRLGTVARLFRSDISVQSAQESKDVATRHVTFRLTDDIVNSEDKLHALFSKWLLHNEPHFDIEDKKAFKKRFGIFKDNARRIHEYNNSCGRIACGIHSNADLTREERFGSHLSKANWLAA
ncbi:hypothetical protein MKW94_022143 [Papaver nudicaule]|uniref:Cathepsin propeptide inhibitor domain-containing protein n=1 Tax=Papaver nudicaule TaxID=74823 RepID=A0AA42AWT0_PAPNU|nr:hypothetical protein [Papaver nudicaule]